MTANTYLPAIELESQVTHKKRGFLIKLFWLAIIKLNKNAIPKEMVICDRAIDVFAIGILVKCFWYGVKACFEVANMFFRHIFFYNSIIQKG